MSGLVSIIIPCFNQEKYIGETLQSVINQTHTNFECFVIDDGSTDQTADIVKALCKKDKRLMYIKQKMEELQLLAIMAFRLHKASLSNF